MGHCYISFTTRQSLTIEMTMRIGDHVVQQNLTMKTETHIMETINNNKLSGMPINVLGNLWSNESDDDRDALE